MMTCDEFVKRYRNMAERTITFVAKARADGFDTLEDELHGIQSIKKNISEKGLCCFLKKLEDLIKQKYLKNGKDFSKMDITELPKIWQFLWDFRRSIINKFISKLSIKDERDFFEYGVYLASNGEDDIKLERMLEKKMNHEKDRHVRILEFYAIDMVLLLCRGIDVEKLNALYSVLDYIVLLEFTPIHCQY